jgi:hypothetical protein
MLIEKDSRRHIAKAIECEQEIKSYEVIEKLKGRVVIHSAVYDQVRKRFLDICGEINSVANTAGKGRSDFDINVLIAAEEITRKITNNKSRAVRKLAEQIKITFNNLRLLLRKYSANIEMVDPQLKNNADLADTLLSLEKAWDKGREFFLNRRELDMLVSLSELIEGLSEKYKEIQEKIESTEAEIFIIIPCLAILKSLDSNNSSLITMFCPPEIDNKKTKEQDSLNNIKTLYHELKLRNDRYDLYNVIEQALLDRPDSRINCLNIHKEEITKLLQDIKSVAIILQRNKPSEWNALLETAMGII